MSLFYYRRRRCCLTSRFFCSLVGTVRPRISLFDAIVVIHTDICMYGSVVFNGSPFFFSVIYLIHVYLYCKCKVKANKENSPWDNAVSVMDDVYVLTVSMWDGIISFYWLYSNWNVLFAVLSTLGEKHLKSCRAGAALLPLFFMSYFWVSSLVGHHFRCCYRCWYDYLGFFKHLHTWP